MTILTGTLFIIDLSQEDLRTVIAESNDWWSPYDDLRRAEDAFHLPLPLLLNLAPAAYRPIPFVSPGSGLLWHEQMNFEHSS